MLCVRERIENTHSGDLQVLPPSLQPSTIGRRTHLPPRSLPLRPLCRRARCRALDASNASTAVGHRVVSESLRHKGRMAEQHREVVAVAQVFEGLCGVLDRELRDGRF